MKKRLTTRDFRPLQLLILSAILGLVLLALSGCGGASGGTPSGISGTLSGVLLRTNTLSTVATNGAVDGIPNNATAHWMQVTVVAGAYDKSDIVMVFHLATLQGSSWVANDGTQLYYYYPSGTSGNPMPDPLNPKSPALFYVDNKTDKMVLVDDPTGNDYSKPVIYNVLAGPTTPGIALQAGSYSYTKPSTYLIRQANVNILIQYYSDNTQAFPAAPTPVSGGGTYILTATLNPFTGRVFDLTNPKTTTIPAQAVGSPIVTAAIQSPPAGAAFIEYVVADQPTGGIPSLVSSSGLIPVTSGGTNSVSCSVPNRNFPFQTAVFAYYSNGLMSSIGNRTPFAYAIGPSAGFSVTPPTASTFNDTSLAGVTWTDAVQGAGSSAFKWMLPGGTSGSGALTDGQTFTVEATAKVNTYLPPNNGTTTPGFPISNGVSISVPNTVITYSDGYPSGSTDPLELSTGSPGVLTGNLSADRTASVTVPLSPTYTGSGANSALGRLDITVEPKVTTVPISATVSNANVPAGTQSVELLVTESGANGVQYASTQPWTASTSGTTTYTVGVADRGNTYSAQLLAFAGASASGGVLATANSTTSISASTGSFGTLSLASNVTGVGFYNKTTMVNSATTLTIFGNQQLQLRPEISLGAVTINTPNGNTQKLAASMIYMSPAFCTFGNGSLVSSYLSVGTTTGIVSSTLGATQLSTYPSASFVAEFAGVTSNAINVTAIPYSAAQVYSWTYSNVPTYAQSLVLTLIGSDPVSGQSLTYQSSAWNVGSTPTPSMPIGVFSTTQTGSSKFYGSVVAFSGPNGTGVQVGHASLASSGSQDSFTSLPATIGITSDFTSIILLPGSGNANEGSTVAFTVQGVTAAGANFAVSNTDPNLTWGTPKVSPSTGHLSVNSAIGAGAYVPILAANFLAETGDSFSETATYAGITTPTSPPSVISVIPNDGTATGTLTKFHLTQRGGR